MQDMIVVTNWEKVNKEDFYLSKPWTSKDNKEDIKHAKKLYKQNKLFYAYEVSALSYALYNAMDAHKIFIDDNGDKVLDCESQVIHNDFSDKWLLDI